VLVMCTRGASKRHGSLTWVAVSVSAIIGLLPAPGFSAPTAQDILRRALDLSAEINDYTAQVQVTSNLGGAESRVPPFTVYFKRPDKVSVKSKSFVVVPRDALMFGNLSKRIEQGAQVMLAGTKTVNGVSHYTLKLMPKDASDPGRVLVTVEGAHWTIRRVEIVEGAKAHATSDWQYALVSGRYWMPAAISCTVPGMAGKAGAQGGELTVTFSGYKVNTGLSDALFQSPQD